MNKAIIFAFLAVVIAAAPTQAIDLPLLGGMMPMVDNVPMVGGLVDGELAMVKSVPLVGGLLYKPSSTGSNSVSRSSSSAQSSASSSSRSGSSSGSLI